MDVRGYFAILLLVLPAFSSEAQPLRFQHLTVDDGLSGNYVRAIVRDRQGFLWIGTHEGLNRYDGYGFEVFRYSPRRPASLSNNTVTALLEDRQGRLWVGTVDGLNQFNRASEDFARYGVEHGLSHATIRRLYEDRDGTVWIGTSSGLHSWDPSSARFTAYTFVPHANAVDPTPAITALLQDSRGNMWVGTQGAGLTLLERDTRTYRSVLIEAGATSDHIGLLHEDVAGRLWVATLPSGPGHAGAALHQFDPLARAYRTFRYTGDDGELAPLGVSGLVENSDGSFWLGSIIGGGFHLFDPEEGIIRERYAYDPRDPASLVWGWVTTLYRDTSGMLWIGTSRGISILDGNRARFGHLKLFPEDPYDTRDNVYPILEDVDGIVWMGVGGPGGLIEFNRATGATRPADFPGPTWVLADDLNGNLWVGTARGLYSFDRLTRRFRAQSGLDRLGGPPDGVVSALHRDRRGHIWIGTATGLSRFEPNTGTFLTFRHDPADPRSLSGNKVRAIFEDRSGYIWAGTNVYNDDVSGIGAEGLNRLDPTTGEFLRFRHDHNDPLTLSNDGINVIMEDRTGTLWIGTDNGMNRMDRETGTFRYYLQEDGLPSSVVVGILEDERGYLWLSTTGGLSRFDPSAETFRNYGPEDGIQNKRFNVGSYFKSRSGEMFFGGVSGLNFFLPEQIIDNPEIPQVVLTSLRLRDGRPGSAGAPSELEEIVLRYRDNAFSVEFAALSFRMPEKNQYAYILEGFDKDWVHSGTRRYASYTNLRPGTYTFRVRGSNNDGVWNEEGASIRVRVLPPWWMTWWAYSLYALALAAGAFGVDRFQRRRLIRNERDRARERELAQAREIEQAYHDLEQTHRHLKATQAQLVQQEKLASLGQLTAGIAHEIKNPLNFINNFADLNQELTRELLDEYHAGQSDVGIEALISDIKDNSSRIAEHGRRADGIVRSMLEHSRGGSGDRVPIDVNRLVEEYTNLAYHGMRAQYTDFECLVEKDLDAMLPPVVLIPQDIGRVLINLLKNAFQAVRQRSLQSPGDYEPRVRVTTSVSEEGVAIKVDDNGPGMDDAVAGRIFEPFFTTKPTGEGTGLGLSLSYEIVTKGHGGALTVVSRPERGSEFVVSLPAVPTPL
jgi:ligand-binding sensor domain-containing protein/signal transduction histidine kinase